MVESDIIIPSHGLHHARVSSESQSRNRVRMRTYYSVFEKLLIIEAVMR